MEPKIISKDELVAEQDAMGSGDFARAKGSDTDQATARITDTSSRLAYRFAPGSPPVLITLFPEAGLKFELATDQVLLIGRDPRRSDLVLLNPSVSQKHCQLTIDDDECSIVDLGSSNGTFINGERIASSRNLRQGDLITIGRYVFMFLWHSFTVASQAEVLHYRDLRALLAQLYPTPGSIQSLLLSANLFSLPVDLTRGTVDQIWDRILEQLRKQDVLAALDKILASARGEYSGNRELRRLHETLQTWKASRQRVGIQDRINTEVKHSARVVREILENHMGPEEQSHSLSLMLDEVTDREDHRTPELALALSEDRPVPPARGIIPSTDLPFDPRNDDSGKFPVISSRAPSTVPRDPEDEPSVPGIPGWPRPALTGVDSAVKKPSAFGPPDEDEVKTVLQDTSSIRSPEQDASSPPPAQANEGRHPQDQPVVEYTRPPSPPPEPQAPSISWGHYATDEYVVTVLPDGEEALPTPRVPEEQELGRDPVFEIVLPPLADGPTRPSSPTTSTAAYAPEPPPRPGAPPWTEAASLPKSEPWIDRGPSAGAGAHDVARAPWQQGEDPFDSSPVPGDRPTPSTPQHQSPQVPIEEGLRTVWLEDRHTSPDTTGTADTSANAAVPALSSRGGEPILPPQDGPSEDLSAATGPSSSGQAEPIGLISHDVQDGENGPDTAKLPAPPWEQNPPPARAWKRPLLLGGAVAAAAAAMILVNIGQPTEIVTVTPSGGSPAQVAKAPESPAASSAEVKELPTYTLPVPGKSEPRAAPATPTSGRPPEESAAGAGARPPAPTAESRAEAPAPPPEPRAKTPASKRGASSKPVTPLFEVLNFLDENGKPKYSADTVPPGAVYDAATGQISSKELRDCRWIDGRQKELRGKKGKTFLQIQCSAGSSPVEGWVNKVALELN